MHQHIYQPADKIAYIQFGTPNGVGGVEWPTNPTGEYTKWQLKDSPAEVASTAKNDALTMYMAASNLFDKMSNDGAMTYDTSQSLKAKLGEAMLAWSDGIDRGAFAFDAATRGAPLSKQMALWSDALTNYAKTQLYAQMVTTALNLLANPVNHPTPAPYASTGFPQVVVVSGTNYEMGVQYGRQTAPAILHNINIFKSKLYDAYGSETVTKDMEVWDYYLTTYDPTLYDWVQGIADGCRQMGYGVSYLDLILLMVYPTELWARPSAPYPPETGIQAAGAAPDAVTQSSANYHSCNTFAANGSATPDGKPIHGITTMVSTQGMDNVILIAFPKDGASFVSQTWPGRLNGNAAMNSDGLAWTMTAILSDTPAWGLTEVYFHYLAQFAKSPADAVAYIQNTPVGGVAGGFILSDKNGISVFETSPDGNPAHSHLRVPGDEGETGPWVVQTNHLVDPSLQAYNPFWLIFIGTYPRYDTVFQFLTEAAPNSVDFSFAKNMFASDDWYDAVAKQWHHNEPGGPGISNDHTSVSQSIFFPADLIAYLQTGTPSGNGLPAYATGEYVKIKLAKDPEAVTHQADDDALAFYWDATDLFEHDLNANALYLTDSLVQIVTDRLDEAFSTYSLGMDRAAFAYLETDPQKQLDLWASALTYYAKAQLYAQMAKTLLLRASGQ